MAQNAAELARRLAEQAESVCRTYLSNGRREGSYWLVGDARNTPGRSMFVRLSGGEGGQQIGKWTDAATGEHGDLLDIIRLSRGLASFADATREVRRFLSLPEPPDSFEPRPRVSPVPSVPIQSARRLFAAGKPILGTIAETYLRRRGITALHGTEALRFHPTCFYRDDTDATARPLPALLAAVNDLDGHLTGLHRTWLAADGHAKADVSYPRRAMGHLLGNAVRFGKIGPIIAVGEGIETVLSLRSLMPEMPMLSALSAAHLAAIKLSLSLHRLYIARDNDPAGIAAAETLAARAIQHGIDAIMLSPTLGDFNDDLRQLGPDAMRTSLRLQLAPEDVGTFLMPGP